MLQFIKDKANFTRTENGGAAYASSLSDCLDLFATIGAIRGASEEEIIKRFEKAFAEDRDIAMKILFFARDIRGGLGERRVFRVIINYLAWMYPEVMAKNIKYIAEYGRWDDLLCLIGTRCEDMVIALIRMQLVQDLSADKGEISLLAKWLPSVNTSNKDAVKLAKILIRKLGMTDKAYRKMLTELRGKIRIIENNLREKDYTFDYSKQPSKAMFKYREAFYRNDGERYREFLNRVEKGEATINTTTLMPYDIVRKCMDRYGDAIAVNEENRKSLNVSWNNLPDYGNSENALVVVDGSGSMYGCGNPLPITVAVSLGIYFAERNTGEFANHFIIFSENPRLVEIKGKDIVDKVQYCMGYNEVANTNIQKVFELILGAAVKNKVPQSDMPSKIYIISDMEFDWCTEDCDTANFEYAKELFAAYGYKLPDVIFWNVQSRNRQQPVTKNEHGVALVSGCNPSLFNQLAGGLVDPYATMMEIISSERYAPISA